MGRGQTATEYLIILAVVIIIALIVIGVLGGIPTIGRGGRARASASYWETAEIGIVSYAVDAAGTDNVFLLRNNLKNTITITEFKLDTTTVEGTDHVVGAGEILTLDSSDIDSHMDCGDAGDTYSYDVEITYTDDITGASYTFTGDGIKLEGECAS